MIRHTWRIFFSVTHNPKWNHQISDKREKTYNRYQAREKRNAIGAKRKESEIKLVPSARKGEWNRFQAREKRNAIGTKSGKSGMVP